MSEHGIRDMCRVCTNWGDDTFVGISCVNGKLSINFPLGFSVSNNEKDLRKDILLLLNTLAATTDKRDSSLQPSAKILKDTGFPFQAYSFLIADFVERGYYKERDIEYRISNKGKINWNRTIKTQKPLISDEDAVYLNLVTRRTPFQENELITLIHEYCVYESFIKLGWLYTSLIPSKPRITLNKKLFLSVIREKLVNTFNDHNKKLFINMIAVIQEMCDIDAPVNFTFGTTRFEYVWERMIDSAFGIKGKEAYFPKTSWEISKELYNNSCLEPDSIMLWNGDVYVLDAKYYKYGATCHPWDLPESTSINKQITYGEYIAEQEQFRKLHGDSFSVFNAFIMPFDSTHEMWQGSDRIHRIGQAKSDWKSNSKTYEQVQGILVDVHYLMQSYKRQQLSEIMKLAESIEKGVSKHQGKGAFVV